MTDQNELREAGHRGKEMSALLLCAGMVRRGDWVKGAPTHVLAELLQELESRGWYLIHEVELTKLRAASRTAEAERPKAEPRSTLRAKAHTSGVCPICLQSVGSSEPSEAEVEAAARLMFDLTTSAAHHWEAVTDPGRDLWRFNARYVLLAARAVKEDKR